MKPVIMYVVPICPHCIRAKRFLTQKGIEFETRNILTSKAYRKEFEKLTDMLTVPVTVIGEKVVVGFNKLEFEQAIAVL